MIKRITLLLAICAPCLCLAGNPIHNITKGKKIRVAFDRAIVDNCGIYVIIKKKVYEAKALRHDSKGLFVFSKEIKYRDEWDKKLPIN